ncbi:hypothetical protein C6562_10415 [Streptococcus suis]|nr:hypothetical protein CR541_01690 [Streptococcus suis]MBS7899628.1 hypothetical protein [Streptococcus suis]MBS7937279.1 hypothetical protein [Streptococcus suis]MBS7974799.1 hypothetical protein [Streptococcus suis]MBS7976812.1 hypothetical protein [Streptococcus suis]
MFFYSSVQVNPRILNWGSLHIVYMVAWFMWRLQGAPEAETAFQGNSPEIVQNKLYQDQRIMN